MTEAPRITVNELQERMESGEDFAVLDTRNPQEWAKSDVKIPEAIRASVNNLDTILSKIAADKPIVTYCT